MRIRLLPALAPLLLVITAAQAEFDHVVTFDPGPANEARLSSPMGLAVGWDGRIYVADSGNNRVVVFDSTGVFLSHIGFAGSGPGRFINPVDVATEGLHLYVLDEGNERVQIFDRFEVFSEILLARERDEMGVTSAIAVDLFGKLYLSDVEADLVRVYQSLTKIQDAEIGGFGSDEGRFRAPMGIAVDRDRRIYVCDRENNRVQVFDPLGGFLATVGDRGGEGALNDPQAIAVDREGTLFVADTGNNRIVVFRRGGHFAEELRGPPGGPRFVTPQGVAVAGTNTLILSDTGNDRVHLFRYRVPPHVPR